MERTFLNGLLSLLYKSKAKAEEFLSCMAKEFRTLELYDDDIEQMCLAEYTLRNEVDVDISDSDTD